MDGTDGTDTDGITRIGIGTRGGGLAVDEDEGDEGVLRIDCDECSQQNTSTCDDCVVSFLLADDHPGAVVLDVVEARAVRAMVEVGLVPELRHRRRTG